MKAATIFNNFARGRLDHDLNSRSDLPVYRNGADAFKNFYSNFKGSAIFRGGFENIVKHEDCAFVRFRFNNTQDYLLLLTALEMKILTYDVDGDVGFVQSGGGDLVVVTPWSLAESKELASEGTAQSGDLMFMVHPSHAPRLLTRVSATSFTLATYVRTADPFTGADAYPAACAIFEGAIYYANTNDQKTTIFRSKIGDFFDMTYGTAADDGFEYDVADLTEPVDWLRAGSNSLVAGSGQALIPINGGGANTAITPTNVTTKISDVDGASSTLPVRKENLLFYINASGRNVNYFNYDIIQETFQSKDANIGSYDITRGKLDKLAYKKDRNNLIWSIREATDLVSLNFNLDERIIGWHEHESVGDFKQLSPLNDNEGAVGLFALIEYDSIFYVCRLSEEFEAPLKYTFFTGKDNKATDKKTYNVFMAEKLKEANYLDISSFVKNYYTTTITYVGDVAVGSDGNITSTGTEFTGGDVGNRIVYKTETGAEYGIFEITAYNANNDVDVTVLAEPTALEYSSWYRSFNTITGLTDYIGQEMSLVGDGGYLGEFLVSAGAEIAVGKEITVGVVGFKYEGLIKTFNLGFQLQGIDTRATTKNIYKAYFTFITSAGVEFGSNLYDMTPIQDFDPAGYYDLPPLPMDGQSEEVIYNDGYETEKFLYIKQSQPLPCHLTGVITEVSYTTSS